MGGMVAALMLAHDGKRVVILEKHNFTGGRLSSFKKQGFTVDLGCHTISRGAKGPAVWPLERCGIKDAIQFDVVRPQSRWHGEVFRFPRDLKGQIPDDDYDGIMQFFADVKAFPKHLIPLMDQFTTEDMLNQYTTNAAVGSGVSRACGMYGGTPQWQLAAGEFIRDMQAEAACHSSGYPKGGCQGITNAYVDALKKFGAEIKLNTPVEKILVKDGKAYGVLTEDGTEYDADIIISNADIQMTMLKLVGEDKLPADYVEKFKNLVWGNTSTVVKVALDAQLTDIKMLTQFTDMDTHEYYRRMTAGDVPDELNLFFVCASNFSPECAPEGCQLWAISTAMPQGCPSGTSKKIQEKVEATLDGWFPGWRDHVIFEDLLDSESLERSMGEHGVGIGLALTPDQVSDKRPSQKTPIENLYLCGAEAGGHGSGIELAAESALDLYDNYLSK